MVQATTTTTPRNNNDNDLVIKVSTTIKSAAESIRQRSYAFLLLQQHRQQQRQQQVGEDDDEVDFEEKEEDKGELPPLSSVNSIIKSIRTAEKEARSYFEDDGISSVSGKLKHDQVIHQGHLLGFNQPPGNAKYLFRVFVNNQRQPWPSETFKDASTKVASHLHQILIQCYEEIVRSTGTRQDTEYTRTTATKETNDEKGHQCQPTTTTTTVAGKKRPRTSSSSSSSPMDHLHLLPPSFQNDTTTANCPLDYFYYHCLNNPDAINCSEHIDRGILICVCLSNNVPGLEIFDNKTKQWLCPEEELMQQSQKSSEATTIAVGGGNNDNGNNVQEQHEDDNIIICIMAGDSLQKNLSNAVVVDVDTIPPCLHRVRNNLESPRLSISYELRT